jgi:PIN domain-containing protein
MNGPRDLTYFTDRDLGHQFPHILRAAGLKVERHDDHFSPLTRDEDWLAIVGRHGWVAVTRDARIRYSPLALHVLMEAGVRLFVIVGKLTARESAELFVARLDDIGSCLAAHQSAFIAKVRRDGVLLWVDHAQWQRRRH